MFRIGSRGAHDVTAAHAEPDRSYAAVAHALHAVEELQNRSGVVHHHLVSEFRPRLNLAKFFSLEAVYGDGLILVVSEFEMDSLAVAIIEIRHHAVVADGADAARDIVELLAHAPDIHVKNHGGERTALFRVGDERFHHCFGGFDLDELFSHLASLSSRSRILLNLLQSTVGVYISNNPEPRKQINLTG